MKKWKIMNEFFFKFHFIDVYWQRQLQLQFLLLLLQLLLLVLNVMVNLIIC